MLTIFATPKPFRGHIGLIQRNAIRSWAQLRPRPDILLLGAEEGTAEMAAEIGAKHVAEVPRNRWGTPLVRGLVETAEAASPHSVLCYVNADIILMSDFAAAVAVAARSKRRFLMIGHRWNLDVPEAIDFDDPTWEAAFRSRVDALGKKDTPDGVDYFVFTRRLWGDIPDFAIGRCAWDNWLVFRARQRLASVVDATSGVVAIHQRHDYSHHPQGYHGVWESEEAQVNWKFAGENQMTIRDATSRISSTGLVANWDTTSLLWHLKRLRVIDPRFGPVLSRVAIRLLLIAESRSLLPRILRILKNGERASA